MGPLTGVASSALRLLACSCSWVPTSSVSIAPRAVRVWETSAQYFTHRAAGGTAIDLKQPAGVEAVCASSNGLMCCWRGSGRG